MLVMSKPKVKRVRATLREIQILEQWYESVCSSHNAAFDEAKTLKQQLADSHVRYDNLLGAYNEVLKQRDVALATVEELRKDALWKETVAANIVSGLRDEIESLRPRTLADIWRSLFS